MQANKFMCSKGFLCTSEINGTLAFTSFICEIWHKMTQAKICALA